MIVRQKLLLTLLVFISICAQAQTGPSSNGDTSSIGRLLSFPSNQIEKLQQKLNGLGQQLDHKTEKYLRKLERQETRIYRKLWKTDSLAAKELMGDVKQRYASLQAEASSQAQRLSAFSQVYSAKLDSLGTTFRFMENSPGIPEGLKKKIAIASQSATGLQHKLNQTDQVRKYLKERKTISECATGKIWADPEIKTVQQAGLLLPAAAKRL
jgi:hypothetical protein